VDCHRRQRYRINDASVGFNWEFAEEDVAHDLTVLDDDERHDHESRAPQPVHQFCLFVSTKCEAI
jgi:hypothetical protein